MLQVSRHDARSEVQTKANGGEAGAGWWVRGLGGKKPRTPALTIVARRCRGNAWCSLQGTRGQLDLWRSGEVAQTHSHTAHPRRNKVRGGAEEKKKKKKKKPSTQQRSQFTVHKPGRKVSSGFVQSSSLLLHPRSDRLPLRILDCMLLLLLLVVVRWPHKGGVGGLLAFFFLSFFFLRSAQEKMSV